LEGRTDHRADGQIAATKQVIYYGFKSAIELGVPRERAGIPVDEQFGTAILRDASLGYCTSCPAEKSGQEGFDFESASPETIRGEPPE